MHLQLTTILEKNVEPKNYQGYPYFEFEYKNAKYFIFVRHPMLPADLGLDDAMDKMGAKQSICPIEFITNPVSVRQKVNTLIKKC